jgi:phenylacetate-CoA ligase
MAGHGLELRRLVFWGLDTLRGGAVRRHLRDLQFIMADPFSDEACRRRAESLRRLLSHAGASVAFYRPLGRGVSLEAFPVVNKEIIRRDYDRFLSESFRGKPLFRVTTSGSTGTPFTVFQDPGKRARHQADNIHHCDLAGYRFGSRLHYCRVWNELNRKHRSTAWMQNIVMQDFRDYSDRVVADFLGQLSRDGSRKSILAYASILEGIARYLALHPMDLSRVRLQTIIAMSESLNEAARRGLEAAFGCPVISRYSNLENGFLAQQCGGESREYHVNWGSFHLEMLDLARDEPVPFGTLGRIVVTDLFNFAMPLIRYDTGDIGILSERSECGRPGPVLSQVDGRHEDAITDTLGNFKCAGVITIPMWKYPSVKQFQFIQEDAKAYRMKLNCEARPFPAETELIQSLKQSLGEDARIEIELTDEIPVLASWKRKPVVNAYKRLGS